MGFHGSVWIAIFFLITGFVLINTVSITPFSSPLEVHATTSEGFPGDVTVSQSSETLTGMPDGKIYQQFILTIDRQENLTLSVTVDAEWIRRSHVDPHTISLYREGADGVWEEVEIAERQAFSKETSLLITRPLSGTYAVIGHESQAASVSPSFGVGKQAIILILVIAILLIIDYHGRWRAGHKKALVDPDHEALLAFVRKSLLAGKSEEEIALTLRSAGWNDEAIAQGIRRVRFF